MTNKEFTYYSASLMLTRAIYHLEANPGDFEATHDAQRILWRARGEVVNGL